MAVPADAGAIRGPAPGGHRARIHQPARSGETSRHLRLCGLRTGPVFLGHQVRQRHRLAEFLETIATCGQRARGLFARHAARRSALPTLRRSPGPRIRRWPGADRLALLYEWRRLEFQTCGMNQDRYIRMDKSHKHSRIAQIFFVVLALAAFAGVAYMREGRAAAGNLAPEIARPGLRWFNVAKPIPIASLRGRIVILDFWTEGCINCIHIIPILRGIEQKYPDQVAVIGVHSPKFAEEKSAESVK